MTHIATMGKPGVPGRWIRVRSPGAEASVLAIEISAGREFDRGSQWLGGEQYCRGGRLRPSERTGRAIAQDEAFRGRRAVGNRPTGDRRQVARRRD